jgi:hypothetical protein
MHSNVKSSRLSGKSFLLMVCKFMLCFSNNIFSLIFPYPALEKLHNTTMHTLLAYCLISNFFNFLQNRRLLDIRLRKLYSFNLNDHCQIYLTFSFINVFFTYCLITSIGVSHSIMHLTKLN